MSTASALLLPLVGLAVVILLILHEVRLMPPPERCFLHLKPLEYSEDCLEGKIRLFLLAAAWKGCSPHIELPESSTSNAAHAIAVRLAQIHPAVLTFRSA